MLFQPALNLALDPGGILRAQNLMPDDWQQRVLLSPAQRILLNCSRGAGKSRTCSALALHTALYRRGALVLLLARSLRQARELLRYVQQGWKSLGQPIPARRHTDTILELANDSRVLSLPGREDTIRAFQGVHLLLIDEAARVPDSLYYSVRPMLNVSQGRLICLSTPFGARGFFWHEWHDEQADWQRFHITWRDCPRISPAAIADERRAMGDAWVAQEYEGSFVTMVGLVYPQFAQALMDSVPTLTGRLVGGIDFGWRNPFAALWGVLDDQDVLWIVGERYAREVPLHQHAAALLRHPGVTWYADPSGRTEIEELRRAGLQVLPGTNDIALGINAVTARLHTGRLKVLRSACPHLLAEANLYRYASEKDAACDSEVPVDADNHALGALRYLISRVDQHFLGRLRQRMKKSAPPQESAPSSPQDEHLWTPLRFTS